MAALADGLGIADETGGNVRRCGRADVAEALRLGRHEEAADTAARGLAEARRFGLVGCYGVLPSTTRRGAVPAGRWEGGGGSPPRLPSSTTRARSGALVTLRGPIAVGRARLADAVRHARRCGASTSSWRSRRTPGRPGPTSRARSRAAIWRRRAPRSARARRPRGGRRRLLGGWPLAGLGCAPRPTRRRGRATGGAAARGRRRRRAVRHAADRPREPRGPGLRGAAGGRARAARRRSGRRRSEAAAAAWRGPPSRTGSPTHAGGSGGRGRRRRPGGGGRGWPRGDADCLRSRRRAARHAGRRPRCRARLGIEEAEARRGRAPEPAPFDLTDREQEVLRQLAAGHTNREIGAGLYMSPKTARVHVSRIFAARRLGPRRGGGVAHRHGLIDQDR